MSSCVLYLLCTGVELMPLYIFVVLCPGQWFVENTGEENGYVNSESDSDSD